MANALVNKIIKSLWVLFAFIPLLNGLGFAYIGAKKSNRNWILEGLIYEIPWILSFVFADFDTVMTALVYIGLILMLISIIRSIMVFAQYKDILIDEDNESRIGTNRNSSPYWVIFSIIIFLNGLGLLIIGRKRDVKEWVYEGIAFEFLWIIAFIIFAINESIGGIFLGLAVGSIILSIICTFIAYFEEKRMDEIGYGTPSKPIVNNPIDNEPKQAKNTDLISNSEIIPEFRAYKNEINGLKDSFNQKEGNITDLINQRFKEGELTYDRFASVISNCHKLFYHHADAALSIISLAPDYSPRLDESVKEKIGILESIIEEMNNLIEELILHDGDDGSDMELDELFSNMDNLINSVKDYK